MKIIVTGGFGFLGSHLVKHLFKKYVGCTILVVDSLTYAANLGNLKGMAAKGYDFKFTKVSIADDYMYKVIKDFKPDVILNLAAQTHVDRSIRHPKEFVETDVVGTFNLVYWTTKLSVDKIFHISTDEVYGPIIKGEAKETNALSPTSPYAASKAAADLLLLSYIKTYDFPITIIRPTNNLGPNQYPEKLIPAVICRLLSGEKAFLHGEGKEIREWIYVEDCCKAISGIMDKGKPQEIYNIGSGVRYSNKEVIYFIIKEMFGADAKFDDYVEYVPNRPGNDFRYAVDSHKTLKLIGEYSTTSFHSGLRKTVNWYKRNKWFWERSYKNIDANIYTDEYLR